VREIDKIQCKLCRDVSAVYDTYEMKYKRMKLTEAQHKLFYLGDLDTKTFFICTKCLTAIEQFTCEIRDKINRGEL
jgi:hypothetical protein